MSRGGRGEGLLPYFPKGTCAAPGTSFASLSFSRMTPAVSSLVYSTVFIDHHLYDKPQASPHLDSLTSFLFERNKVLAQSTTEQHRSGLLLGAYSPVGETQRSYHIKIKALGFLWGADHSPLP